MKMRLDYALSQQFLDSLLRLFSCQIISEWGELSPISIFNFELLVSSDIIAYLGVDAYLLPRVSLFSSVLRKVPLHFKKYASFGKLLQRMHFRFLLLRCTVYFKF